MGHAIAAACEKDNQAKDCNLQLRWLGMAEKDRTEKTETETETETEKFGHQFGPR